MTDILLLNGPNLNLLGQREPQKYGHTTLKDLESQLHEIANENNVSLATFQSNSEAALIDRIHQAKSEGIQFILINPAAFTHTSIALRDALLAIDLPFIEIHISNIHARESFRTFSYLSDIAYGIICGLGLNGYKLALNAAIEFIKI
ncbi:type II 3-dehydroquinate dehydratase [Thiotrichales bacterium 19S3-7]|nr:type II 3-dehydroquinate dehydratase [Thiotrichales bacterium 19S3-7]MCF6801493.1 type II 3-dehydroquinate dehydratase [Thiotrichales bacterium 19S3-11]